MKKLLLAMLIIAAFVTATSAKTYNIKSDNDSIIIKKGDKIIIELPENPSTGYSWDFSSSDENVIKITNKNLVYPKPLKGEPPLCGAPGTAVYTIKAISQGTSTINGQYIRPWLKNQPDRTYSLRIIVK